jgi:hypothetical protein
MNYGRKPGIRSGQRHFEWPKGDYSGTLSNWTERGDSADLRVTC